MTEHDRDHDRRLDELLARGGDPLRALADSELDGCATCERIVREVLELERGLPAGASAEQPAFAAGTPAAGRSAEAAAAWEREERAVEVAPLEQGRVSRVLSAVLFLAVALAGLLLFREDEPAFPEASEPAAGGGLELVRPLGEVDEFGPFLWDGPLGGDERFVLRIYDGEVDRALGHDAIVEIELHVPHWAPEDPAREPFDGSEAVPEWPDRIRWSVETRRADDAGAPIDRASGVAWRAP